MSTTLVFPCIGYSNTIGYGTAPSVDDSAPPLLYTPTGADIDALYLDGFIGRASEPLWNSTLERSGGTVQHAVTDPPANLSCSPWTTFADRLRALGETRKILLLPLALGGSTSTQWNTGAIARDFTVLLNIMGQRLIQASRLPNMLLGGVMYDSGLNEVSSPGNATWTTNVTAVLNAINTFATAQSMTWAKTHHFWLGRLQNPNAPAFDATDVTNMIAAQDAMASGRSDTLTVQEPASVIGGLVTQHLKADAQKQFGINFANSWYAAA